MSLSFIAKDIWTLKNRLLTLVFFWTFHISYELLLKLSLLKVSILTSVMKTNVEIQYTTSILPKTDVV